MAAKVLYGVLTQLGKHSARTLGNPTTRAEALKRAQKHHDKYPDKRVGVFRLQKAKLFKPVKK